MKCRPLFRLAFPLASAIAAMMAGQSAQGANGTWGANGNSAWYTNTNWVSNTIPGLQGVAASNTDTATFNSTFTATTVGINMGTNSLNLGAVSIDATRITATNIGNSSATGGVLRLYGATVNGVANVIVRNAGTGLLTLQASQAGTMGVVLSNVTDNIVNIDGTGGVTISSAISESAAGRKLTKGGSGTGVLTLTGANTYTGATTINSGTINLGGGTATGSLNSTILTLGGGAFNYTRTGNTTQGFTTTNINGGAATQISVVAGNTLNLGTVTRGAGANLDFSTTGAGTVAALAASNTSGIMAGFTVGDSWAVANGAGVAISGLAGGSYTLTSVAGTTVGSYLNANVDVDDNSGAPAAAITANSLRFSANAANTLTLATGPNTITSGGILVGSGVGGNLSTITGGTLTGVANKDLSIIQNNASGGLTISSSIVNTTLTSVTKSGAGLLTLDGNNTFTGGVAINAGTLALGNAGALNSTAGSQNAVTFGASSTGTLALTGNSVVVANLSTNTATPGTTFVQNANGSSVSNATLTVGNSTNASGTFAGIIRDGTGGGTLALTKAGTGTLTLSGANTYSGGTTLTAGTVVVSNATSFGASTGAVTVSGTSRINATGGITYANDIVVNAALTMQNPNLTTSTATFSGVLSGAGSLSLANSGTNGQQGILSFTNTANTFTGDVVLSTTGAGDEHFQFNSLGDGGKFTFAKNGNRQLITHTGSSNITFDTRQINIASTMTNITTRQGLDGGGGNPVSSFFSSGTGTVSFNSNMGMTSLASDGVFYFNGTNAGNNTFAGTIGDPTGTGKLWIGKLGTGTWLLTGDNTYEGGTIIAGGILSVGKIEIAANAQPLGKGSLIQFGVGNNGASGSLVFTGSTNSTTDKQVVIGAMNQANSVAAGSILNNGSGTLTFSNANFNPTISGNVVAGVTTNAVTVARTLTIGGSNTGANTISGIIQNNNGATGTVAITKTGTGNWTLSNAASSYTGATTIQAGALVAGANAPSAAAGAFGNASSAIVLGNGSTLAGDAPSLLVNGAFTIGRAITVGSVANTAAYNATIGGSNTTGTSLYTGNITLNATATNYTTTLQAATGGTVQFTTGTWTTNNKAIRIGSTGNAGTVILSNAITTSGGISVNHGTLALNSAFTGGMTVASGATLSGTGSVSGTTGVTGATVNGTGLVLTGTVTFNGAGNTLSGTVTSTAGVTVASGAVLAANGTLTGNAGVSSTGTLKGSGAVTGAVTVGANGVLAPGNSIESLAVGSLSMGASSTYEFEVVDNSATGADLLAVDTTVSLAGVSLGLDPATIAALSGGGWNIGDKLTLISYLGPDLTSGFTGFFDDTEYLYGSNSWLFNYNDTVAGDNHALDAVASGQDRFVTLTVVPEPRAALLGGLGILALLRRRR